MNITKSVIISIVTALFSGIAAGGIIAVNKTKPVFSADNTACIILDAGHGEPDGGAVGSLGTIEKDINLSIVQKTGEILEGRGIRVIYTRTNDNAIYDDTASTIREMKVSDLKNRRKIMENSNADMFISIHMNSFSNASANGLHIFYSAKYEQIQPLAEAMQKNISSVTGAEAHTVKTISEKLFLMKNPPLPCILAECGFLSNPKEEQLLSDENYQSKIAWAIADSVYDFIE